MNANDIQIFVIKIVKILGQSCLCCVKKYPFHSCIMLFLFLLYMFFPLVFIILICSFPVVGLAFLVHRVFIGIDVGAKSKRWKELKSRRSFKSVNCVHAPNQYNESSSMHDQPVAWQNAKETSNEIYTNKTAEEKDDFSTNFNDYLVDKRTLVEKNPKYIREAESVVGRRLWSSSNASQPLMPVNHYRFGEGCQKCGFYNCNNEIQESLDVCEDEEERHEHGNKVVRWIEDDEKSQMDLGISEVERTKRLESLMARRRSRKLSSFQVRRNGTGVGLGNTSCGQISSLHILKMNPCLADNSGNPTSPVPGSAPSYMVPHNPFDLPYDPHEEKPILTGDSFQEEFMATHHKEPILCRHEHFNLDNFIPPESMHDKQETSFDSDFATKKLTSGRLGTSTVANKEDDDKQPQQDSSISNDGIDHNHAREGGESSEKVVDVVDIPDEAAGTEAYTKEREVHHDVSSDQSSSLSSSSDDEPIRRPNKEAILHCLSMSRMRVASIAEGHNFHRHAESYDCGPSALFDKTKADCFFFGGNKRIHYTSTNSIASDLQVEVSEVGSPPSTNISSVDEEASIHDMDMERGKGSHVNSTNPSEMDVNELRLRDVDEVSEQGTIEAESSRWDLDPDSLESTMKPEKTDEHDAHYFTEKDSQLTHDQKDSYAKPEEPSTSEKLKSQLKAKNHVNDPEKCEDKDLDNMNVDPQQGNDQNLSVLEPHGEKGTTRVIKEEVSKVAQDEDAFQKLGSTFEKPDQDREGGCGVLKIETQSHPSPSVNLSDRVSLQASAPISSSSSPKFILPNEVSVGQYSTSVCEINSEVPDQDGEGKPGVLEVETQSLIRPSPYLEMANIYRLPVSTPSSISSSSKLLSLGEVSADPSSTSTCEVDNEVPNQDKEDPVLETETKSLVHPSPSAGQADPTNMQVSAPTSSSSSPKFISQTEVSINQPSSITREMDSKPQVSNMEMEQASKSYEQRAPDRFTEVGSEQAPITSTSPMYVSQPELSTAQGREGKLGVLEVETQSLFHPSPPLEQVNITRVPVSAPAPIASSPKSTSQLEVSTDPSSMSTREMDNDVPDQDSKDQILETKTKSLVSPPPSTGLADTPNIQASAPTSSSTSPKFLSQTKVSVDQFSSLNREMDNEAQVSNTEIEQASQSYNQSARDQPTEVAVEQVPITSTSPIAVLPSGSSTDPASPSNFVHEVVNEVQQSGNGTSAVESFDQLLPDSLPPTENDCHSRRSSEVTSVAPVINDSSSKIDDPDVKNVSRDNENIPNV